MSVSCLLRTSTLDNLILTVYEIKKILKKTPLLIELTLIFQLVRWIYRSSFKWIQTVGSLFRPSFFPPFPKHCCVLCTTNIWSCYCIWLTLLHFFNYCREVSGVEQCFRSARKNGWEIGERGVNLLCFQPATMLWGWAQYYRRAQIQP